MVPPVSDNAAAAAPDHRESLWIACRAELTGFREQIRYGNRPYARDDGIDLGVVRAILGDSLAR